MPSTGIIQVMRGVTGDPNADYYGESWPNVNGDSLHAAYFFGDNQKMVFSKGYDYSFHQRALSLVGTPTRGSGFATPDASNYYSLPFSDTALAAAGTADQWTWCGVAKGNGTDGSLFSAEHPTDLAGFRAWISSGGTFSPHMYDADGPSGSANPTITGTNGTWDFMAVSFSASLVKSYRKNAAGGWTTNTATPSPASMSTSGLNFLVGRRTPNTSAAGGISIVSEAFYNRVMTDTEIQTTIYNKVKAFLAAQSYAIAI